MDPHSNDFQRLLYRALVSRAIPPVWADAGPQGTTRYRIYCVDWDTTGGGAALPAITEQTPPIPIRPEDLLAIVTGQRTYADWKLTKDTQRLQIRKPAGSAYSNVSSTFQFTLVKRSKRS